MRKSFTRLAGGFEEAQRQDLIFMNNPVFVQGLGLTPVVLAATTLKNAAILAVSLSLLCFFTRLICYTLIHGVPYRLRTMVYAIVSAALYIPLMMLLNLVFGTGMQNIIAVLPVIVVDTLVLSYSQKVSRELMSSMLLNTLQTAIGFSMATLFTGALREFIGYGTLWGATVINVRIAPLISSPIGGFITAALLAALLQSGLNYYRKIMARRQHRSVQ